MLFLLRKLNYYNIKLFELKGNFLLNLKNNKLHFFQYFLINMNDYKFLFYF